MAYICVTPLKQATIHPVQNPKAIQYNSYPIPRVGQRWPAGQPVRKP